MIKKNHHYIPVFYQKFFSTNKKSIGKFIINTQKYISEASIKKTGCQEYMYGEDSNIEDYLMNIENHASGIIREILETGVVPNKHSEEYQWLLLFLVIMETRIEKQAEYQNRLVDAQMKIALGMKINHGQLNFKKEDLEKVNIGLNIPTLGGIQVASDIFMILSDLNMGLIFSTNDREFITSDNPVVRYNYMFNVRDYTLRNYGLGHMGIQLFFPLSPKVCLYVYDGVMYNTKLNINDNIYLKKASEVDKLNSLFMMNSYNFILFRNTVKESYIIKLVKGKVNLGSNTNGIHVFGSDDNKLIINEFGCVKKLFNFSFVEINKEFKNMPLPAHMAGPLRPNASNFNKRNR